MNKRYKNFRITDFPLFKDKVCELSIDVNDLHRGSITINGISHLGKHSDDLYKDDYGFVLEDPFFFIFDSSASCDQLVYVDAQGNNTTLEENAMLFCSQKEAESYIQENNWSDWCGAAEIENKDY